MSKTKHTVVFEADTRAIRKELSELEARAKKLQPAFRVFLQRTRSKKSCVCIVSASNGKLVLKGEPINRTIDAVKVGQSLIEAMGGEPYVIEVLPWDHKWPTNAGPKKKT